MKRCSSDCSREAAAASAAQTDACVISFSLHLPHADRVPRLAIRMAWSLHDSRRHINPLAPSLRERARDGERRWREDREEEEGGRRRKSSPFTLCFFDEDQPFLSRTQNERERERGMSFRLFSSSQPWLPSVSLLTSSSAAALTSLSLSSLSRKMIKLESCSARLPTQGFHSADTRSIAHTP